VSFKHPSAAVGSEHKLSPQRIIRLIGVGGIGASSILEKIVLPGMVLNPTAVF
jgi:hypothetical protein